MPLELLKFYQELGANEIINEDRFNRLENRNDSGKILSNQIIPDIINNQTPLAQNDNLPVEIIGTTNVSVEISSKTEIGVRRYNVIIENFGNMSQSEAISKLIKKQQADFGGQKQILTPIGETVKETKELVNKVDNLKDLEKAVKNFEGCNLKKMATNTVFCDGDPKSEIMIIGEAPGNHEDLQGIPFCGDSGKLLNEMFAAINLPRDKLYITNTLFWRPPGNRRPTDDELALCRPFVEKHIALVKPKLIALMGATAMASLLRINEPISKIRGKFLEYENDFLEKPIKVITLFHPSYLMRQPDKKRLAWQDLLTIDNFLKNE